MKQKQETQGINRTFMELKQAYYGKNLGISSGINRTFMELKPAPDNLPTERRLCINRTFMELKQGSTDSDSDTYKY